MAVCNLFKPINKPTGNFLLFSQYSNDLTTSATFTTIYKVFPSKFIALNIDYSNYDNASITKTIQNNYENACAYFKNMGVIPWNKANEQETKEWSPEISRNLFWRMLLEKRLINVETKQVNDEQITYCKEMMYCGDINIQSNNTYQGDGYNEVYCYIPSTNNCQYIECKTSEPNDMDIAFPYTNDYVVGYENNDDLGDLVKVDEDLEYNPHSNIDFLFETTDNQFINQDIEKYDFNTIIVLYDIYVDDDDTPKYKNIPMGIHFCGTISEATTTNPSTIFVSNDDIYGCGTSYGLRLCTRFSVTDSSNVIEINPNYDPVYPGFCIAMSAVAEVLDKADEIINSVYKNSQLNKDVLAIFKNSRTNVPYIKYIGTTPYWFVNGRNTGVQATAVADHTNYEYQEIKDEFEKLEETLGYDTTIINTPK